ncbi:MAG: putative 2-aminoethylphosphonate ABC transporter substrate-binding protein [Hyphomicrobiaceae bacterium]|nr:putative 2-aminoethylphosphonate ABC transporter substrate-binding protein [Hyphomicrobiaceae bacterium]
MRRSLGLLATALIAAGSCLVSLAAEAKTELTVYTAYENDDLAAYKAAFEKAYPDIVVNWVRDSTGVVTAKLLAEKDNPRADVVWGLAVSNIDFLKARGVLQAYKPAGFEKIPDKFRDAADPPVWFGNSAWICAIVYNEIEGKKRNIPAPKTWSDLTDPVYKGQIVMPHPASSGTGFMYVVAWIQAYGEDAAWKLMDGLHENISRYTHSGSAPAVIAARGEQVIGLAFELRGSRLKQDGAPIELVMPSEALGWDMNAFAVVRDTKKLEAAKTLADWAASEEAMKIYGATRSVVAMPWLAKEMPFIPKDIGERIMKQDFAWSAENRDRVLAEWEKRYGGKAEPKKK